MLLEAGGVPGVAGRKAIGRSEEPPTPRKRQNVATVLGPAILCVGLSPAKLPQPPCCVLLCRLSVCGLTLSLESPIIRISPREGSGYIGKWSARDQWPLQENLHCSVLAARGTCM